MKIEQETARKMEHVSPERGRFRVKSANTYKESQLRGQRSKQAENRGVPWNVLHTPLPCYAWTP